MSSPRNTVLAVGVVSLPLLAEVIRKYIFASNLVMLVAEMAAIVVAVAVVLWKPTRAMLTLSAAILVITTWGLVSIILGHQNPALGMVGLRTFVVPCAFLLVAVGLSRSLGKDAMALLLYRLFTWWLIALGAVSVVQLVVGRDHWLNAIPEGFGDERAGIGDYTVAEAGLEFLFRPTAVFLHTGKLGAVLFVLVSYRLCFAAARGPTGTSFWIARLFDVAILAISGQRSAMLGYVLVAIAVLAMKVKRPLVTLASLAVLGGAIVGFLSLSEKSLSGDGGIGIPGLVVMRFASAIADIPARIDENVMQPLAYVLDRYSILPAGVGAFSLGSTVFGGQPLYDVVPIGASENSWLRLVAEQGIVGLILTGAFWTGLVACSIVAGRKGHSIWSASKEMESHNVVAICPGIVLTVFFLWANTHDVLGNTTAMSLSMMLFGIVFGSRRLSGAKVEQEGSQFPRSLGFHW